MKKWWMWMAVVAAAVGVACTASCTEEQNKATTACLTSIVPQASTCIGLCGILPPKECAVSCAEKIVGGAAPICVTAYGNLKSPEFGAAVGVVTQGLVDVYYALRVDLMTKSSAICAPCPVCDPSDVVPTKLNLKLHEVAQPLDALKVPVAIPIPDPSPDVNPGSK